MRNILYHQVREITGLGVKLIPLDRRVSLYKPGLSSDTTQGGWVTPGRYILQFDESRTHAVTGALDSDRIEDAASKGEGILYKILRAEYGSLPFTNDNFTIPTGWDYETGVLATSTLDLSTDTIFATSFDASDAGDTPIVLERNRSLDSGVVIELQEGETLVVGIGNPGGTIANVRGTDGFTVHCSTSPTWRTMPFGLGDGVYDVDVWSRFKANVSGITSNLTYDDSRTFVNDGFEVYYDVRENIVPCVDDEERSLAVSDCSTIGYVIDRGSDQYEVLDYITERVVGYKSDSRMGTAEDHEQFEYITEVLYNTAIKYWQVKDTASAYTIQEQHDIWAAFKFVCYNAQYGMGDWCEGITAKRHMAHGVQKASVKRHLNAMKLFFVAAILDEAGAYGNYKPSFEGLYKMASVAQTMKASFPSVVSYGRFNNGSRGLLEAGTDTASEWLAPMLLNASGPTGLPYEDMYCDGEYRQAGLAIKLWFAKLLGLELPPSIQQFLHLPQNGAAVTRPWGLTNSRYGHISTPSGVGSSYSDKHNAYTAQAMQWLWLTGEYDHTPMMQWFTRNIHFSDPAWMGAYEGNLSTLPGAYLLQEGANVLDAPLVTSADVPFGTGEISLTWSDAYPSGKTYEVYQIIDAKVGGELRTLGVEVTEGTLEHDLAYGVVSGTYRLVASTTDTSATIPHTGDGDYYFVVRSVKGARKSRHSSLEKVVVAGAQQWGNNRVSDEDAGIDWEFSTDETVGVYADGSPWVLAPVSITGTTANGESVLDLSVGQPQPFDPNSPNYESSVGITWPLSVTGAGSIITTTTGTGGVENMGVLTVVTSVPAVGSFRPAPYAGSTPLALNVSDVTGDGTSSDVTSTGDMFLDRNSTRVETYSYRLDDFWYYGDSDEPTSNNRNRIRPSNQMMRRPHEAATVFHEAALLLHSSDADKSLLYNHMVQQCIDMVGSMESAQAAGNRPNPVAARSAGLILKRLTGQTTGTYTPTGTASVLDSRAYVIDTNDDRFVADASTGTILTGISAGGVRDFAGRPVGWVRDLTTSTDNTSFGRPDSDVDEDSSARPRRTLWVDRAEDASWAALEALSVSLFNQGEEDYGNKAALYFGHQESRSRILVGDTRVGALPSDFAQQTFDGLESDTFTSGVRGNDSSLGNNYERPRREMLPDVVPSLPRLGIVGNIIDKPGTYANFATKETIHIRANDVTIQGAHIDARRWQNCVDCPDEFSGLTLDRCVLAGSNGAALKAKGVIVKDCIISNISANGLNIGSDSTVSGCYFERISHVGAGDYFGIIVNGGSNITISKNYINTPYDASGSKVINAIRLRPKSDDLSAVTVTGNWLRGGTGPGLRVGAFPSAGNTAGDIVISKNRFSMESGTSEAWSVATPVSSAVTFSDNHWWNPDTDNVVRDEITEPDYSVPGGPSNP